MNYKKKKVKRLAETWILLREANEPKHNLMKNLNENYSSLLKGNFYQIEQEV